MKKLLFIHLIMVSFFTIAQASDPEKSIIEISKNPIFSHKNKDDRQFEEFIGKVDQFILSSKVQEMNDLISIQKVTNNSQEFQNFLVMGHKKELTEAQEFYNQGEKAIAYLYLANAIDSRVQSYLFLSKDGKNLLSDLFKTSLKYYEEKENTIKEEDKLDYNRQCARIKSRTGDLCLHSGEFEEGIRLLNEATKYDPEAWTALYTLFSGLIKTEKKEEKKYYSKEMAIKCLQERHKVEPKEPGTLYNIASFYFQEKKYDLSKEYATLTTNLTMNDVGEEKNDLRVQNIKFANIILQKIDEIQTPPKNQKSSNQTFCGLKKGFFN